MQLATARSDVSSPDPLRESCGRRVPGDDPWVVEAAERGARYGIKAYTAREWDPEINLYYYRARYYDPKIGRFISEDPIRLRGGINLYAYVSANPTTFSDPLGLFKLVPGVPPVKNSIMREFLECMDCCTGREQTITATTGPEKHQDPGHAGGTSVDVRPTGTPSKIMFSCAASCGAAYALDERSRRTKYWSGAHYHFQLVPPKEPKLPNDLPTGGGSGKAGCKPCRKVSE